MNINSLKTKKYLLAILSALAITAFVSVFFIIKNKKGDENKTAIQNQSEADKKAAETEKQKNELELLMNAKKEQAIASSRNGAAAAAISDPKKTADQQKKELEARMNKYNIKIDPAEKEREAGRQKMELEALMKK